MNMWAKLITALKGGINEAGEAIVDNQALRILDQELREANEELKISKDSLVSIMAKQKVAEEKCRGIKKSLDEYEDYAIKALDKGDEELAREIAEKMVDLKNQYDDELDSASRYEDSAKKIRSSVQQIERKLKQLKQQIDTVRATENVQRAQAAVAERYSGAQSKFHTAMESLDRIKEKQAHKEAQMSAAEEVANEVAEQSLQAKLKKAGITSADEGVEEMLAELKRKQSKEN